MNLLDLTRHVLQARQGDAGGDSGGVGSGTNSGMSGSSGGSRGSSGSSTSNYGSRQGFAGATNYGSDSSRDSGGDSSARNAASASARAQAAKAEADRMESEQAAERAAAAKAKAAAEQADREADDRARAMKEKQARDLADANPRMTDLDALIGANANFAKDTDPREVSPGGWTYGQVSTLNKMGFGDAEGTNANNPTQSVGGVLGSRTMNDKVMPAVAGLVTSMVPGAGLMMSGVRAAQRVATGETSFGDEAKDFAIDYFGSKAAGMINSKVAEAVGYDTYGNLKTASSISGMLGGPTMPNIGASAVNGALGLAGISKSTGPGYSSQNNSDADNGFTAPGTTYGGNGRGDGLLGIGTPRVATPATPTAQVDSADMQGVDINLWGSMNGEGWRSVKQQHSDKKRMKS